MFNWIGGRLKSPEQREYEQARTLYLNNMTTFAKEAEKIQEEYKKGLEEARAEIIRETFGPDAKTSDNLKEKNVTPVSASSYSDFFSSFFKT